MVLHDTIKVEKRIKIVIKIDVYFGFDGYISRNINYIVLLDFVICLERA